MDQPALFPIAALKTEGYAQPEPHDDDTAAENDDTEAEAA